MEHLLDEFKTTDIVLAASLRVHGHNLEQIEVAGTKGTFVFNNIDRNFLLDYDLGNVRVEPVALNNAIKQLTTSVRRMVQAS